jgi:hypothetical protein
MSKNPPSEARVFKISRMEELCLQRILHIMNGIGAVIGPIQYLAGNGSPGSPVFWLSLCLKENSTLLKRPFSHRQI